MAKRKRHRHRSGPVIRSVHGLGSLKGKKHKPLKLLKMFHSKMVRNTGRLEELIRRRQAAGER